MTSMVHAERMDAPFRRLVSADCVSPDCAPRGAPRLPVDQRSLSTLIESEIIPRLVVAHASGTFVQPDASARGGNPTITPSDIETLVALSLEVEADALIGHVDAVLARGVPADAVLVDLLPPAAHLLGRFWEEDRCDFVDVTMALWRMQEVVHELAARAPGRPRADAGDNRALFAAMPGDQHSFGTVVIDEVFRREGWLTERMSETERSDLLHRAAEGWFDLIGLTVTCDCHIGAVSPMIVALRNVSRNPRVCVMVGGRIFSANPALAEQVGADGTARDAKLALRLADTLVRAREREAAVLC